MKLGINSLLEDESLLSALRGQRVALLGHPASVTHQGHHSLDVLMERPDIDLVCAFGPQHGMRGEKQDNMIESDDYTDPRHKIPVFSLYGRYRYPTEEMLTCFDLLLVDLQDIGTRIYTFVTTLLYMLEACAEHNKGLWVLDRPNPAGRPIEGSILEPGWESFIGPAALIMRHGLTLGELARYFVHLKQLDLDLRIIPMTGYEPDAGPGFGWPLLDLAWVNPSPNAASLNMARAFPGTVLFEGTTLSEGRGTTTPLELVGAPDIDATAVQRHMQDLKPEWLEGCLLRPCHFEPTFQKHIGKLCAGIQIHTDNNHYQHHRFKPYRLGALLLKAIRHLYPDYDLWHQSPYEYETDSLAIDLLSGGTFLREWVDNPKLGPADLDERLRQDEAEWSELRTPFLLY
jgi:uncharacterized protein YbbC (DUF1343 family)